MSAPEFIVSMVGSLAWPLVTVVGVLVFKKPIAALMAGTVGGRKLQRLKLGPAEAEWEKLDQAQHDAASGADDENKSVGDGQVTDPQLQEVLEFASRAPEAAVIRTSQNLEHELSELLNGHGLLPRGGLRWNMARAIDMALTEGLIDGKVASTLNDLRRLRNEVVHGAGEVSPARSALYVLTAADAIEELREIPRETNPLE